METTPLSNSECPAPDKQKIEEIAKPAACPPQEQDSPVWVWDSAEPWPQPVNGDLLLEELAHTLSRFVILPKWAPPTLALWILHTYAFQLRNVSTYLGIESPEKRCGKTRLLTLLSQLVNRPVVAANISPPAFFRVIEETRPTLLIDEADNLLQGNDELRGILNSGYTRETAYVVRVAQGTQAPSQPNPNFTPGSSRMKLAKFSCWCPKAMAAIGRLPDTLSDRCILIRMQRKTRREECDRLRNLEPVSFRRRCARFVLDHAEAIAKARPEIPPALHDRAAEVWEPLFVLADLAGGSWPTRAREAAEALTETANENNPIVSLLLDILRVFVSYDKDRLFSRTIVHNLNAIPQFVEQRPWQEFTNGKKATELWMARQLRPYGIRPRTIWINNQQSKGYMLEDFSETVRRYVSKTEFETLKHPLAVPRPTQPPPASLRKII